MYKVSLFPSIERKTSQIVKVFPFSLPLIYCTHFYNKTMLEQYNGQKMGDVTFNRIILKYIKRKDRYGGHVLFFSGTEFILLTLTENGLHI